jgi:isoleucyl-tRNA synthetase
MKKDVIKFWKKNNIFEKSLSRDKEFVFYDGPPFATGTPHYGHLLASTIKDVIPRFKTMDGFKVNRRFGWDCHGLPIEHEINKLLGMNAQEAVKSLGVKGYNDACRGIVTKYTKEWEQTITKLGRWVDFENNYKTMDKNFMESVWFVFKSLFDKGLVYKDNKVLPYSTGLNTVLSNFEASSNYKTVNEESVTVLFQLNSGEYLSVWTTTPWTLPENAAICVNKNIDYVSYVENNKTIIASLESYNKMFNNNDYNSLFKGSSLVGKTYKQPFNQKECLVVEDDYVTSSSGTGLVHLSPCFGDDDYRVCKKNNIFGEDHLDESGNFKKYFVGVYFKDANKLVINFLKEHQILYKKENVSHSYPFCPRTGVPLIYRAVPAWYISVEKIKNDLVKNNQEINWTPDHIKNGRFGKWLENAQDWCVSRNRVWGTPIPIWINDKNGNIKCFGSSEELKLLSGVELNDLHRENVDDISFSIKGEEGVYRRIPEVLDCWFESGSMPYSIVPSNSNGDNYISADFIAEGLDQTRGWFYSLNVISTALHNKAAFKNVIVNGLVLSENGIKMSKSLKNYTDPNELIDEFGADAVRLYMLNSGLTKGEEQSFSNEGVKNIVKEFIIPLNNSLKFFKTYAEIDNFKYKKQIVTNVTDKWLLSRLVTLTNKLYDDFNNYKLYNATKDIVKFIDDLNNWYIRLNRQRFWQKDCQDKYEAYYTLYTCLLNLSKIIAPLAPFISEEIYQDLKCFCVENQEESVHLCFWPKLDNFQDSFLEDCFNRMQEVVILARKKREQEKIKTKIPLNSLTVFCDDKRYFSNLEYYIKSELNVKNLFFSKENETFEFLVKPNFKSLKDKNQDINEFKKYISNKSYESLIKDDSINKEFLLIEKRSKNKNVICGQHSAILLDCELTNDLINEGVIREFVSMVQNERKNQKLNITDLITINLSCDVNFLNLFNNYKEYIKSETLCNEVNFGDLDKKFKINEFIFGFELERYCK